MFEISIRANVKDISRKLDALKNQQVPFATVSAINSLLALVQKAERENMVAVLDRPTPFTLSSVRVGRARKGNPQGIVFVQDRAAGYLQPFETGGMHKLIGKGKTWLSPKDKSLLNKYGNFSKSMLQALKGRGDIFVGEVKFKSGKKIGGVWQRNPISRGSRSDGGYGTKGALGKVEGQKTTLRLLIRFGDAISVRQHLDYRKRAEGVVRSNLNREFGRALAKALATARP